jgi:hypothetical protein
MITGLNGENLPLWIDAARTAGLHVLLTAQR